MNDDEIWEKVKSLEGKELTTYVEHERNYILKVEDTNSINDRVIIVDRATFPTREDIIAKYKLLFIQKKLNRKKDLTWLSTPSKKVSSIVFRIIGEITKSYSKVEWERKEPVLIIKK